MESTSKCISLAEAVSQNIADGHVVFVGGFGQCIPFAVGHEIIRQRRKELTLCRSGADILFDLLIAAGTTRKVIAGYVGNPGIGLAHAFRRAVQSGEIEVEDWTNFSLVLRLHAGALGIPYIPTATLIGGDMPGHVDVRSIKCPFTGETLRAVPALRPDVAIVHAQRADEDGNIQLFGLTGDTLDGALASRRIIATVEEIVPRSVIRQMPDRTVLPGFRVAAVAHVPWGAYPSYVDGYYTRDDEAYGEWDELARSDEKLAAYIETDVLGTESFSETISRIDTRRLDALRKARRELPELSQGGAK